MRFRDAIFQSCKDEGVVGSNIIMRILFLSALIFAFPFLFHVHVCILTGER